MLSNTDGQTGSGIAATRILNALLSRSLKVEMLVRRKITNQIEIKTISPNFLSRFDYIVRILFSKVICKFQKDNNINFHSTSFLKSKINFNKKYGDFDVINLHWIGNETISISQIAKIKKPIVWTLHDSWPFL